MTRALGWGIFTFGLLIAVNLQQELAGVLGGVISIAGLYIGGVVK